MPVSTYDRRKLTDAAPTVPVSEEVSLTAPLALGGELAVSQISLADAFAYVCARHLLPEEILKEVRSALRVVERATGLDATEILAAPENLNPIIEAATPGRSKIKPKRWANAKSWIRKLLRARGLHAPVITKAHSLHPRWSCLIDVLVTREERFAVLGFALWAEESDVWPETVSETTLQEYARFRRTHTLRAGLNQLEGTIRRVWNRAVTRSSPGWPTRLLKSFKNSNIEAVPILDFPASFRDDLDRYLTNRTDPAFDESSDKWRPATARAVRAHLIRAASIVAQQRGGTQHVRSLADIVAVPAFEYVCRHVYERAGKVWRAGGQNFVTYLVVLARDHVRVDDATLARLEEVRAVVMKRVRAQRKPGLSERVSGRLIPFDDRKILRRLFLLPGDLYRRAKEELKGRPVRAAQIHEQALLLDILQLDPMRRYNLASLQIEDFIQDDERVTRLRVSGDRVKNGILIDTPIPTSIVRRFHEHLSEYRPHLRGAQSPWLFPSPNGHHRSPRNITDAIKRIVKKELGVLFTPHMMRHILATVLYRANAANGPVVQRKLRHTTLKATESMYGIMSNSSSNEEWQRELDNYRKARTRAKTRRRDPKTPHETANK